MPSLKGNIGGNMTDYAYFQSVWFPCLCSPYQRLE